MSSSRTIVPLVLLSLCGAQLAHGQEAITEQQFLARIDGALPELQRFEAAELAAEAALVETQRLPPLGLSYEREEVFVGGQGLALKNSLSLDWSLDVSGSRGKRSRSAELRVRATEEQSKYAKQLVLIEALKIYKRAARARLRVASLASTRAPLATLVEGLANRAREGDASGYDLARFELELADHDELLTAAKSEELVAETELAALLDAGALRIIASDDLALPTRAGEDQDSSPRSDVLASQFEEASGKALQAAASRWWIPKLDFSVGYLNTDLGQGRGIAHGYTATISADMALFSRGRAEKLRGQARTRQASAERQVLERNIRSEVQSAHTHLIAKIEQARQYEKHQLAQTAALLHTTKAAYEGGEVSSLELRDAHARVSAASLRMIELRYQCGLAQLALWRASGSLGHGESK